jgi:hypothetical protein
MNIGIFTARGAKPLTAPNTNKHFPLKSHTHTHTFIIYVCICCLFDDAVSSSGCTATKHWITVNETVSFGNEAETCGLQLTDVWKNPVKPRMSLVCVFVVPTGIRSRHLPKADGKCYDFIKYFSFLIQVNNYREYKN